MTIFGLLIPQNKASDGAKPSRAITPRKRTTTKRPRKRGLFQNSLMKAFPVINPVQSYRVTNPDIRW
jgi:hypothetical protein